MFLRKLAHRMPLGFDGNGRMQRNLAPLGSAVGQQQHVADFRQLQRRALNSRLVQQRRGIEQAVEIEAAAVAKISAKLFGQLLLALDPLRDRATGKRGNARLSKRGSSSRPRAVRAGGQTRARARWCAEWGREPSSKIKLIVQEPSRRSARLPPSALRIHAFVHP